MTTRAEPRGPRICDPAVEVHRQIRPGWWLQAGRPSSQVFKPMPADEGALSLADGRRRTPEQAYIFATTVANVESCGVATMQVGEFEAGGVEVSEDAFIAAEDGLDDPFHVAADFRHLGRKQIDRLAKRLAESARIELMRDPLPIELPDPVPF